jgi:hypothetical protein
VCIYIAFRFREDITEPTGICPRFLVLGVLSGGYRCKRAELGRAWLVRARLVYFEARLELEFELDTSLEMLLELGSIRLEPCSSSSSSSINFGMYMYIHLAKMIQS